MRKKRNRKDFFNIKLLMFEKGITQEELAKKMGVGAATLNRKLNGKAPWFLDEGKLLADILGVTLNDLFMPNVFPNGNKKRMAK